MSFSNPETAPQLFAKAKATELDELIKNQIRAIDPFNVFLFESETARGRYNLDSMLSMPVLFWTKASEHPLLQAFNGNLTMKDICCFGQSVEQNQCFAVDMLSPDALQYAVNQIIETTEGIQRAQVAVFGVNTSRINDGNDEIVVREIVEIREQIRMNNQPDPDIFTMDVLIFPLFANGDPACIIIINPVSLLARTNGPDRAPAILIEIGTKQDMNNDVRRHIDTILDSHRITHRRGPFRNEEVTYDAIKDIVIPRAEGAPFERQFQLLYMLKKILENNGGIQKYLEGSLEELMVVDRETRLEMKEIRINILRFIAHDVHQTGTELQRYLYERRVQELGMQERERQTTLRENVDVEQVRGESFVSFPPIYQILH